MGAIAASVFAYFGYQSVSAVNDRSDRNIEHANTILIKAEDQIKRFEEQSIKLASAQDEVEKIKINLAALSIREASSRFEQLMDQIALDQLHRTGDLLDELQEVADSVAVIKDHSCPRSVLKKN